MAPASPVPASKLPPYVHVRPAALAAAASASATAAAVAAATTSRAVDAATVVGLADASRRRRRGGDTDTSTRWADSGVPLRRGDEPRAGLATGGAAAPEGGGAIAVATGAVEKGTRDTKWVSVSSGESASTTVSTGASTVAVAAASTAAAPSPPPSSGTNASVSATRKPSSDPGMEPRRGRVRRSPRCVWRPCRPPSNAAPVPESAPSTGGNEAPLWRADVCASASANSCAVSRAMWPSRGPSWTPAAGLSAFGSPTSVPLASGTLPGSSDASWSCSRACGWWRRSLSRPRAPSSDAGVRLARRRVVDDDGDGRVRDRDRLSDRDGGEVVADGAALGSDSSCCVGVATSGTGAAAAAPVAESAPTDTTTPVPAVSHRLSNTTEMRDAPGMVTATDRLLLSPGSPFTGTVAGCTGWSLSSTWTRRTYRTVVPAASLFTAA